FYVMEASLQAVAGPWHDIVRRTTGMKHHATTVPRRVALSVLLAALAGCKLPAGSAPGLVWGLHGVHIRERLQPGAGACGNPGHPDLADLTDRIQVFDRDGRYLRGWRTPEFNVDGPSGLTVDRLGRLLVADTHFYRVLVYSETGELLFQLGDGVQGTT